jgi:NitT/TauT family transport system substrate-binding protein
MPINSADPAQAPAPGGTPAGTAATADKALAARLTRRGALALAPAVALVAGCSSSKDKKTTGGTGDGALDQVTYMTGFGTFGREAYAYVADAKGFFRDNGIKVKIVPGSGQEADLAGLIAGKIDFQTTETSMFVSLMAKGYKDARIIGAIHQRTVVALMALPDRGIKRPQDLVNRTIAYGGVAPRLLFPAYARLAGFDAATVKWVRATPPTLPGELASRKVDAIGQFVTGTPLIKAATRQQSIVVLPFGDYLPDLTGNLLATSTNMIKNKPDLVRRFVDALMKGLSYAMANPEECGAIMNQAVSTTAAAIATAELQVMKPYVMTGGSAVGGLTEAGIAQVIALLTSVGLVPQGALIPDNVADFNFVPKPH